MPKPTSLPLPRSLRLDLLRAVAMLWMAGFHLCFDLNHYGLMTPQNFYTDAFWTGQRTGIVSLFLFTAGAAQSVAVGQPAARFWRRWAQIAGCALLVSAGSWWMVPHSWISFGVLHGVAVMLLILRGVERLPMGALLALAAAAWLAPQLGSHAWFDQRATWWIGLVTHKPRTEDFVPVLPWLGVMLLGLVAGPSRHRPFAETLTLAAELLHAPPAHSDRPANSLHIPA